MATTFSVDGPREVPVYQGKAGPTITDENIQRFWNENKDVAAHRGCYVFGVRAGKGWTPAYVGKATKVIQARGLLASHADPISAVSCRLPKGDADAVLCHLTGEEGRSEFGASSVNLSSSSFRRGLPRIQI